MIKVEYNTATPEIWKLLEDYSRDDIVVPAGFITDLASTPRFAWAFFPRWGRYAEAAVVHDYLCVLGLGYTAKQIDTIFYRHMVEDGAAHWRAFIMWTAVRAFGKKPGVKQWKQ